MSDCGTVANCVTEATLRNQYFSSNNPERQPYFHYGVNADLLVRGSPPAITTFSGQANTLGTNLIITLGRDNFHPNRLPTQAEHRGTIMHELGHNLNLTHNGNGFAAANGTVHWSVMNYRYQYPGVPGGVGVLADTYSFGTHGSESCTTSPKQRCNDARFLALITFGNPAACTLLDPNCDVDVNEWNGWFSTDWVWGTQNPDHQAGNGASAGSDQTSQLLDDPSPAELAPLREAIERNQKDSPDRKQGPVKAVDLDVWQGPVPDLGASRRKALVAQNAKSLEARGLKRDKDFFVSDDGESVHELCQ